MADLTNSGDKPKDLHSVFVSKVKGVSYEEAVSKKKTDPEYKMLRQFLKAPHLSFPGGVGYAKMRSMILKLGLTPKYEILYQSKDERSVKSMCRRIKQEIDNVRIDRIAKCEWAVVYDELVGVKATMFNMYPELEEFLKKKHYEFQNGNTKWFMNDWDEWELEPTHYYEIDGVERDNCSYCALCNGFLMQSAAAKGAKSMTVNVIKKYYKSDEVRPLAFIHDEIVGEVKDNENIHQNIADISEIMIDSMQEVLYTVRVAVEASVMDYWQKSGGLWEVGYFKNKPVTDEIGRILSRSNLEKI